MANKDLEIGDRVMLSPNHEGVSNDALDGGWKAVEISVYAKRLETDLSAVTAQRDELLSAMKIVTTGTVGDILDRLHEFHALVAKCEAKP